MNADQIRLDRPTSGLQRLEACFGGHAYDLHRHETYGIGLTLYGVQQFHYRGSLRASQHCGSANAARPVNSRGGLESDFWHHADCRHPSADWCDCRQLQR